MDWLNGLRQSLIELLPVLLILVLVIAVISVINWLYKRPVAARADQRFKQQVITLACLLTGLVLTILVMPVEESTRNQLLALLGLILTAIITLSSTTFVANMMASLMLRSVNSFRPGDFIRVGEQFGRVTERGLFHTEIQTEDRDLTTLPNLYLVTHPVSVLHSNGTVVSASVSLGYDNPTGEVESLLIDAAEKAQLRDPFVHVLELGDYAVTYRVAGFLEETKQLLTVRSQLRKNMISGLHAGGVEIVSPQFVNQRRLGADSVVLPAVSEEHLSPDSGNGRADIPEEQLFDKAERAEKMEELHAELEQLQQEIADLKQQKGAADAVEATRLEGEIELREIRSRRIQLTLEHNRNAD